MKIITIARKPLSESNVASNVLKHGCGALNVDASRIATTDGKPHFEDRAQGVSLKSDWIGQGGMFSEDRYLLLRKVRYKIPMRQLLAPSPRGCTQFSVDSLQT